MMLLPVIACVAVLIVAVTIAFCRARRISDEAALRQYRELVELKKRRENKIERANGETTPESNGCQSEE